jgi:predicted phosphodiesterase
MKVRLALAVVSISLLSVGSVAADDTAQQTPSFSFGAAGDFDFDAAFKATAAAVKTENPDFFIALGDLGYKTSEEDWCNYWTRTVLYNRLVLIAGNHDSGEDPNGDINRYVKFCPFPLSSSVEGKYGKQYYFDYPAGAPLARFILVVPGLHGSHLGIDTNYDSGHPGYKFTAAAIDDARAKGIEWIFVAMHKNYISMMEKSNEISQDKGNTFMAMLLDKKVDVILQGHEHGYERSKQLSTVPKTCPVLVPNQFNAACVVDSDDTLVKGAGTVIHVIGTGGKEPRNLNFKDAEAGYFAKPDNESTGFGKFTVTPTSVSFVFRPSSGKLADSYTITKGSPSTGTSDTSTTDTTVRHLSAQQLFAYVESVQADPKVDRKKAEAYLQTVLDGKTKPPNHGCNGVRTCTTNADCITDECPEGFCAGSKEQPNRTCLQF